MKRSNVFFTLLLSLLICSQNGFAQSWKWAVGSICPHGIIEAWPIAVDSSGNVYASGGISSLVSDSATFSVFGTDTVHGKKNVLISTDSTGHIRWVLPIKTTGYGMITKIAMGPTGDVYLFGSFDNKFVMPADSLYTPVWDTAGFCARIDSAGHVKWLKKYVDYLCTKSDVTGDVDGMGNAYIAGGFSGLYTVVGATTLTNSSAPGYSDAFLVKLDTAGNPVWAKSFGGDTTDYIQAIATNLSGDVVVTGVYNSDHFVVGTTSFDNTSLFNYFFYIRFDNLGNPVWEHNIVNTSGYTSVSNVAFDQWDNSYLTGTYGHDLTFGSITLPWTYVYWGTYLTQFSNAGTPMWAKTLYQCSGSYSIAPDGCGNVWVAGATGHGIDDAFIAKYDIFGTFLDSFNIGCGGDDQSNIVVDNKGNLYWGADYLAQTILGPDTLKILDSTRETMMVAKYNYPFCPDVKSTPLQNQTTAVTPFGITLYPNPASDEFTITTAGNNSGLSHAELYDVTGRKVESCSLHGKSIATVAVNKLQPGIYTCKIFTGDQMISIKKLVISK